MTYLIDSDQIINYLKGIPDVVQLIQRLMPEGLAISAVSHAEVIAGVYGTRDPLRSEAGYRSLLQDVTILPLTEAIGEEYGRIYLELRQRGLLIAVPDMLIAATAQHHGLTLVTRNVKDFGRITTLSMHTS